jgi:leucyl/phenylalanyl-tRNA--protein transferase
MDSVLTPETLLKAYTVGIFPMADSRDAPEIYWVDPRRRGILPMQHFRYSRSLRKRIRTCGFTITADTAFDAVVAACADREETWINPQIRSLYHSLHETGHAHALEVWDGSELAGGVYGVAIGGAFFGESMFSARRDGSKIALAYLTDRLLICGFTLFDTQFITGHLRSLGAEEISRSAYHDRLARAIRLPAQFDADSPFPSPQELLQRRSQTS